MSQANQSTNRDYLYTLADRGQYNELIKHICKHNNEAVRYGAAGVLAESTSGYETVITDEGRNALLRSVLNDPSDTVRGEVTEILLNIDEELLDNVIARFATTDVTTPTQQPYPRILTTWHVSEHASLRFLAVIGFGREGSTTSKSKLRATLKEEDDMRVLRRAVEETGNVCSEKAVTPVQRLLRADKEYFTVPSNTEQITRIKHAAVDALIKIGTDAAYEALVTASRSTDAELKQYVISEIGRFGAQDTLDLILNELDTDNDDVRADAAEGVITSFKEAPVEDSDDIREDAIQALTDGEVDVDVTKEFTGIVENADDAGEKRNAAWLLTQLDADMTDNDATTTCLAAALREDDEYLPGIAAAGLTQYEWHEIQSDVERVLTAAEDGSDAKHYAAYVKSTFENTAKEAKKNLVEYTRVEKPSDYTSKR